MTLARCAANLVRGATLGLIAGTLAWGAAAAQAQQKPPLKIGLIATKSGPVGSYGRTQEILVKLSVEDVNAAGGINGSLLELRSEDAQLDPGQAVLLFRKLASEGALGVIGPMTGTQWETVSPLANQIHLPAIAVNAAKPGITVRPWTIRLVGADDRSVPDGLNAFLKANPKLKKVVIVADVREATGKAGAAQYKDLVQKAGLELLDVVEITTTATDLSAAVIKAKGSNPDFIISVTLAPSALLLAKEFAAQGFSKPILGHSMIYPGPFVSMVGDNGKNWHTYGPSTNEHVPGDNALYKSVVKRAQERADPTLGVPLNVANWSVSYDAVQLYADILRRRGVDGNTDINKVREIIKEEFLSLKSFDKLYHYTMRDTGDAYIPVRIVVPDTKRKEWMYAN
jgi:ABC-type branched-subunit amino acid transport system substrate-binding protein